MSRFLVASIVSMCCAASAAAQIYRWVDPHGTVTFSSVPPEHTKAVVIEAAPRIASPASPASLAMPILDSLGIANRAPAANPYRDEVALALRVARRAQLIRDLRVRCQLERAADCDDDTLLESRYQRALDWMLPTR